MAGQHFADFSQRREAHAFYLSRTQQRQVLLGNTYLVSQFFTLDFALGEHHVELDLNWHDQALHKLSVFGLQPAALDQQVADHPKHDRNGQYPGLTAANRNGKHLVSGAMIGG